MALRPFRCYGCCSREALNWLPRQSSSQSVRCGRRSMDLRRRYFCEQFDTNARYTGVSLVDQLVRIDHLSSTYADDCPIAGQMEWQSTLVSCVLPVARLHRRRNRHRLDATNLYLTRFQSSGAAALRVSVTFGL
jgi:hypothetical protein